jgi:hypothetical protein
MFLNDDKNNEDQKVELKDYCFFQISFENW